MGNDRKIVFVTGTRADYGKIKPLMKKVEAEPGFGLFIYACGMHLLKEFGSTYNEIIKDGYRNIHVASEDSMGKDMANNLGDMILEFSKYVDEIKPDLIVVHGDRIDALGAACVGALKNIKVAHIEGGELSGTIDDSIRHAISKMAHLHFVCNEDAKKRLVQMGEDEKAIFTIGSPDIDVMLSKSIPPLSEAKEHYDIGFDKYGIVIYHPVTTEYQDLPSNIESFIAALKESKKNYIVVLPNNDLGFPIILDAYKKKLVGDEHFKLFPSIRFEYFLSLLKGADFMIGNSSAGVRETSIYGVPAIDVGTRQHNRYDTKKAQNIIHTNYGKDEMLDAISQIDGHRIVSSVFGDGHSSERFIAELRKEEIWNRPLQKSFHDLWLKYD